MKRRVIKYVYFLLIIISILIFIKLIIRPMKKIVEFAAYDTEKSIDFYEFNSPIEQVIVVEDKPIFRLMYFLEEGTYDNLNIGIYRENGDKILETFVPEYSPNMMFFEFPPLEKGKYLLKISDEDGDPITLSRAYSDGNAYLKNDKEHTVRLVTYYSDNHYFYLWYPLFMFVFLITLYPFVRGEEYEKK